MGPIADDGALFARGPVVLFKWRNVEGWPVEFVSANTDEVFGYSPDQFLSGEIAYASLIHAEDQERVGAEVGAGAASAAGSFVHEPYRVLHADGSIRWLYDVTHVLRPSPNEEPSHFVGYVIDITQRIRAEEERQALERKILHTQKLESLGILAGGVAHDFNNLLTGILGEAGLAELEVLPEQDELRRSLASIQLLARRAADLTRELLAYSGRGQFVVEPVDASDVVKEMVGMLETVISKKADLVLDLSEVPAINADRAQIQQVVMNLITNASDALGSESGTIEVTVSVHGDCAHLSDLADRSCVRITVADTGCGMDDGVKAQIYDPFFTTKSAGRGLGMSAVQGIVRAHHGVVNVTSTPGEGTTFSLSFPSAGKGVAKQKRSVVSTSWTAKGTALVVDDEPGVRMVAQKMFALLGFDTLTAADGGEGVRVFEKHRDVITIALVDMTMPVLSGIETLEALRELAPDLPIILSSGYTHDGRFVEITGEDITYFLQKPYQISRFKALVRAVIDPGSKTESEA